MKDDNLDINMAFRVSREHKTILKNIVAEYDTSLSLLIRAMCRLLAEEKITITRELLEEEKNNIAVRHANKKPLRSPGRPRKKQIAA